MNLMILEKTICENAFFEGSVLKMYSECLSSQQIIKVAQASSFFWESFLNSIKKFY